MLVMKFGGTSVGDARCFRRVHEIIAERLRDRRPLVVVVSAMSTITETLLSSARFAAAGDDAALQEKLAHLERKHLQAIEELFAGEQRTQVRKSVEQIIAEFRQLCAGMALLGEL